MITMIMIAPQIVYRLGLSLIARKFVELASF